ncbi:hypothetical protein FCM35_KLT15935 [Carex littledalei]|uniref:Uncharacterized protein n=1 Tax=Carex littledalei TaxID=544730 RepID=A0A833RF64_9POAL|nr:hypothetical protein FCM35_KLT15935 [Carex littledalei]
MEYDLKDIRGGYIPNNVRRFIGTLYMTLVQESTFRGSSAIANSPPRCILQYLTVQFSPNQVSILFD